MAPLNYYYLISLALMGAGLYLLALLIYISIRGKVLFGMIIEKDTPEYKRMMSIAGKKGYFLTFVINAVLAANLSISILVLAQSSWPDRYGVLIIMPIVILITYVIIIAFQRNYYKAQGPINSKNSHIKKNNDDDSWLK